MTEKWTTEFPTEPGTYWFYGYRYGKVSCGHTCDPELMLVEVWEISNGLMYVASGQHMFKSEVECPHFCEAELPEFPDF